MAFRSTTRPLFAAALLTLVAALSVLGYGCGGDGENDPARSPAEAIAAADRVDKADFPATDGAKTLDQIRQAANAAPSHETALMLATNNFVAGRVNRVPFGLFSLDREPIWGPTVMYVAAGPDTPAQGPFIVAAHALDVPARYRSKTSAGDYDTIGSGFYAALVNAGKDARNVQLMTLTRTDDGVVSAIAGLTLVADDPTPAPGEKAPAVDTETLDDAKPSQLCTRKPIDEMHDVNLKDALGRGKPIVLIFSTPALCASRVCGPVNDVATQVQADVGDEAIFIHQEIFKANDANAGFRTQVREYGLTSEPYTFVIDGDGRVAAQLAGPFVAEELRAALDIAGLKRPGA